MALNLNKNLKLYYSIKEVAQIPDPTTITWSPYGIPMESS